MRTRSLVLLGSVAVIAVFVAGCSTSTSAPSSTSPAPSPMSPTASPSPSIDGSVLPPVPIDGKKKAVDATVGDTLNVTIAGVTKVSTDNPEVLEVSQPRDDGSAQFYGGAKVLAPGTAKLTIEAPSGTTVVTVTATA